jgi:hypothetical protein
LSLSSEGKKIPHQLSEVAIGPPRLQTENGSGDAQFATTCHIPAQAISFLFWSA